MLTGVGAQMQILVDADACPVVIREILYRAAQKRAAQTHLVRESVFSGARLSA